MLWVRAVVREWVRWEVVRVGQSEPRKSFAVGPVWVWAEVRWLVRSEEVREDEVMGRNVKLLVGSQRAGWGERRVWRARRASGVGGA